MATKNVPLHPQRASFDASVLSKRTSFEMLDKDVSQNKKRCSLEVKSASAPPAQSSGPELTPLGASWAPTYPMPLGMPMGMPLGAMSMGMPFCFPPPFIPPFMMPTAMAMWQQAMQQATAAYPCTAMTMPYSGLMPVSYFSSVQPASTPAFVMPCDAVYSSVAKGGCSATTSSSSVLDTPASLNDSDFDTFIDSFLDIPKGTLHSSDSALALSSSFDCELNLLANSVSELSDLTEYCKPLDLQLTPNESSLNLLDLDLSIYGECH